MPGEPAFTSTTTRAPGSHWIENINSKRQRMTFAWKLWSRAKRFHEKGASIITDVELEDCVNDALSDMKPVLQVEQACIRRKHWPYVLKKVEMMIKAQYKKDNRFYPGQWHFDLTMALEWESDLSLLKD